MMIKRMTFILLFLLQELTIGTTQKADSTKQIIIKPAEDTTVQLPETSPALEKAGEILPISKQNFKQYAKWLSQAIKEKEYYKQRALAAEKKAAYYASLPPKIDTVLATPHYNILPTQTKIIVPKVNKTKLPKLYFTRNIPASSVLGDTTDGKLELDSFYSYTEYTNLK